MVARDPRDRGSAGPSRARRNELEAVGAGEQRSSTPRQAIDKLEVMGRFARDLTACCVVAWAAACLPPVAEVSGKACDPDGRCPQGLVCSVSSRCVDPHGPGTVTLTWDGPTLRADGTALTALCGYRIYEAASSGGYTSGQALQQLTASAIGGSLQATVDGLGAGPHYFVVTAFDPDGYESVFSNETFITL
jgi:hypothetical protein